MPVPSSEPNPAIEPLLQQLRDRLRPGQQQIADWQAGELAVSAVPGAGKSTGMAGAAALTIARQHLNLQRQLLIVTFTRSAAANLKGKVRSLLQQLQLPPGGFTVQTLHGLALAIASRHPAQSGLSLEDTALVTPTQSSRLVRAAVDQWIAETPYLYAKLLEGRSFDGEETERLRRQSVLRTEILPDLAQAVIHEAKSSGVLAADLALLGETTVLAASGAALGEETTELTETDYLPILTIAAGLYERYQALLQKRGLIDYDDMILAALRALADPAVRKTWQQQIYAVFEDEAQDSTPLQTQLLEILGADPQEPERSPNLVRVGDPNQAINSTFTPADPIFFREFCERCQRHNRLVTMDQAGRSSPIIIDAANFVLGWVNQVYPGQPFRSQFIRPVPKGDPQPQANPEPAGQGLEIYLPEDIYQSVELIRQRVVALFALNPQAQAAILVRENKQGRFLAQQLADLPKDHGIPVYEVGQSDRYSHVPAEVLAMLQFIQRPHSPDALKAALTVLTQRQLIPAQDLNRLTSLPEQFLYPGPLDAQQAELQTEPVRQARRYCTGLLQARIALPMTQLLGFLGLTLNYDATELATIDKLTDHLLRRAMGDSSLANLVAILSELVSAERFEPVEPDASDSRYTQPGQLTIITMHKAKGLDWDYVFLPFLQAQTLPGVLRVPPQAQFLGDFTLAEVARAQLRSYLHSPWRQNDATASTKVGAPAGDLPNTLSAWQQASHLKQAEEFRLLYVAMTRAKRLLWLAAEQQAPFTWNKVETLEQRPPCPVIPALAQRFPGALLPNPDLPPKD